MACLSSSSRPFIQHLMPPRKPRTYPSQGGGAPCSSASASAVQTPPSSSPGVHLQPAFCRAQSPRPFLSKRDPLCFAHYLLLTKLCVGVSPTPNPRLRPTLTIFLIAVDSRLSVFPDESFPGRFSEIILTETAGASSCDSYSLDLGKRSRRQGAVGLLVASMVKTNVTASDYHHSPLVAP